MPLSSLVLTRPRLDWPRVEFHAKFAIKPGLIGANVTVHRRCLTFSSSSTNDDL